MQRYVPELRCKKYYVYMYTGIVIHCTLCGGNCISRLENLTGNCLTFDFLSVSGHIDILLVNSSSADPLQGQIIILNSPETLWRCKTRSLSGPFLPPLTHLTPLFTNTPPLPQSQSSTQPQPQTARSNDRTKFNFLGQ